MSLPLLQRKLAICWCLVAASPTISFGQENVTPQGAEYGIVGALPGDQVHSSAAISTSGGFLTWEDNSVKTLGLRIRVAHLGPDLLADGLPISVSSAVASKTAGDQEKPQVALLADGGGVVVWQGGKPGLQQIYARFLDADGSFSGKSDIRVGAHTKNNQINPAIARLASGDVVVVWASFGQDGSMQGVFGQILTATGAKVGGEFQVNQFTPNNQRSPAVAALADGNFVVAWISELERSSSSVDVYARIFGPTGAPVSSEFLVNTDPKLCANPSVAGTSDGRFAVAWSQNDNSSLVTVNSNYVSAGSITRSTRSWDVFGRLFDASGVSSNAAACLNTRTFGDQFAPRLSASGTQLLAVWTSLGQDGSWEGVFGQAFSSNGDFEGDEIPVNTTTISRQIQPTAASDGAGRYLAVWSSFGGLGDFELLAQVYLQTGN
jgi:hypothetical protein